MSHIIKYAPWLYCGSSHLCHFTELLCRLSVIFLNKNKVWRWGRGEKIGWRMILTIICQNDVKKETSLISNLHPHFKLMLSEWFIWNSVLWFPLTVSNLSQIVSVFILKLSQWDTKYWFAMPWFEVFHQYYYVKYMSLCQWISHMRSASDMRS
jgi:hypothetical protein